MKTSTVLINNETEVKVFKLNYNLSILVDLYKHTNLIPLLDHEHYSRYKQNIFLPNLKKLYG